MSVCWFSQKLNSSSIPPVRYIRCFAASIHHLPQTHTAFLNEFFCFFSFSHSSIHTCITTISTRIQSLERLHWLSAPSLVCENLFRPKVMRKPHMKLSNILMFNKATAIHPAMVNMIHMKVPVPANITEASTTKRIWHKNRLPSKIPPTSQAVGHLNTTIRTMLEDPSKLYRMLYSVYW